MDRIDVMRLFTRIVDRGSFAQAARDLQIPRPTATHAIQRLEQNLGVRLLERTTRVVRLTLDGSLYLERCKRLLADIDEADNLFRKAAPQGPLRVDMQGTIARFFIVPALPDFMARYPEIDLNLSETDRMVDLVTEGVDCVVRAGELADSSLVGRKLASFEQGTFASPDYLHRHGIPATPDALHGHVMVAYAASSTGEPYPLQFSAGGRHLDIALPHSVLVRGAEIYTASAMAGLGLIQVPRYRVMQQIENGELVKVLPDYPPPALPVWILYPENRHLSSRVRVFVHWLAELFRGSN